MTAFKTEPIKAGTWFIYWLTQGIGTSGKMPADSSKDGVTTLKELYLYIKKESENTPISHDGASYYQHVQVYPQDREYELFKRKK